MKHVFRYRTGGISTFGMKSREGKEMPEEWGVSPSKVKSSRELRQLGDSLAIWTNKHLIMVGSLCRLETRFRIKPFPGGRNQLLKKWLLIMIFYGCIEDCILFGDCFHKLRLDLANIHCFQPHSLINTF